MKQVVANHTTTAVGGNCCTKCNSSIKLKQRLKEEGYELVTNCHQLKMSAADSKNYLTDAADTVISMIEQPEVFNKSAEVATCRKFRQVSMEGSRQVSRMCASAPRHSERR